MKNNVAVICRENDPIANQESVKWAQDYVRTKLEEKGVSVTVGSESADADVTIRIEGPDAQNLPATVTLPQKPESFALASDRNQVHVVGSDARGVVYALTELADRIQHAEDAVAALQQLTPTSEQPANKIRSIHRLFVNEVDDKKWFYDKTFWQEYLTELSAQRFNRFNLALGITYDLGHNPDIKDFYFGFAYPYLVSVPGYEVEVAGLSADERAKNLDMIRFIGREAGRRGLEFQLGIWSHAYEPEESPDLRHRVTGLNADNHAEYCREAVKTLLQQCPEIDGITFRIHYESGIPEPAHEFWNVVLKGVAECGRPVGMDLHPKGMYDEILDAARNTGVPFDLSPKFWAEHMGLPYHQASIRATELPIDPNPEAGSMIITTTSRRFTRYGYADFYKEDRDYGVFTRIWPGTQRVLLWGDPEIAAEYGRAGSFLGSKGIELFEPLSFKSRKASETKYGRDPYVDKSLQFDGQEWKKYKYSYRLWGRLLYNPDADPDNWRRYLRSEFKDAASPMEEALKQASKVLPLVTVAHHPSAANNNYWTEMYYNMSFIDKGKPSREYGFDSAPNHTFNAASSLDPVLFYNVYEYVDDVLNDRKSARITPLQTARKLDQLADAAEAQLQKAKQAAQDTNAVEFRRWTIDIEAQIGLARFFAAKFRTGVAYAWFERLRDASWLDQALEHYRAAKQAWEHIVDATKDAYADDLTFGFVHFMRGHWSDRLQVIEEDIQLMEQQRDKAVDQPSADAADKVRRAMERVGWNQAGESGLVYGRTARECRHNPPGSFQAGQDFKLELDVPGGDQVSVRLKYRVANQSQPYQTVDMQRDGERFTAVIPAAYTENSPYPLVYLFEVEDENGPAFYPGFADNLSNQPYFTARQK